MYIFFEKGTRGGVSYVSNRYSKTNNKYLRFYDPNQESRHFILTNNLNGHAKSKFLWRSCFKLIDPNEFYLNKYTSNSSKGYVLKLILKN